MRTQNDAIRCSREIAEKDTAVDHYKNYIKVLANSIRYNQMMIDDDGKVLAQKNLAAAQTYGLLKFS